MLVLSRKSGQTIRVGKDIVITVVEISKGRTRIGVTAPKDVPIHREEIYDQILEEESGVSNEEN